MDMRAVQLDEIWTLLREAEIMAREMGLPMLVYLIGMARIEAQETRTKGERRRQAN